MDDNTDDINWHAAGCAGAYLQTATHALEKAVFHIYAMDDWCTEKYGPRSAKVLESLKEVHNLFNEYLSKKG